MAWLVRHSRHNGPDAQNARPISCCGADIERKEKAVKLEIGSRENFGRVEFRNAAGLQVALYKNGGTINICLDGLMVNQVEGHPLQGGLDRVYLRTHGIGGIQSFGVSGTTAACSVHENGAVWRRKTAGLEASMQLLLHPELPILFRVCRAQNNSTESVMLDWMAGQDLGLADPGVLKNNEAYACQYLDHKIAAHTVAGQVVLSRNNLHPTNPFAVNCCLQGAQSASTDGYQFFGRSSKLSGIPAALNSSTLENRVKQYEFAYAALQSRTIKLQPGQSNTTVFALYVLKEHPQVSSTEDLALVDEILKTLLPDPGDKTSDCTANAFFSHAPLLRVESLDDAELKGFFEGEWRHSEYFARQELYSFFCGDNTHVVLPTKESVVERPHGTILTSAHGATPGDNILCVTCYGYGAFGSQFSVGNTTYGRFSTIQRNSLNLERSSGIRLFALVSGTWRQLAFPSVLAMERDRVRWIYKTDESCFEVIAQATTQTIEYTAVAISGAMPALRVTWEVCGTPNEFDGAPQVEWDAQGKLLSILPAEESLLNTKFPGSCLLARLDTADGSIGGAQMLGGTNEPYVVMDIPSGEFRLTLTGHYDGKSEAMDRFEQAKVPDWDSLTAHFNLTADSPVAAKLSDTIKWYAHNAMIHFAAPRGMEQYSAAAWGTRDVCQGPLEFLLALGHDQVVADMLCVIFAHQYADTGTWPQWFMFDEFREIQNHGAHGDIIFWPIKALCDYIEQTGNLAILDKGVVYTDPESFAFTTQAAPLHEHVKKALNYIYHTCVAGTALPCYGEGDWDDSLQPANPAMKTRLVSGWTAGLAYQTLTTLSVVWSIAGFTRDVEELDAFLLRMKKDFETHVIKDGVVAGFVLFDAEKTSQLLHPSDNVTGIHYRLLPINRAIISELFSPAEMALHLDLVHRHLWFPDGVRLMDRPLAYKGGTSVHFQRAETAAHFGREIGLQYVHANIRYCEALAKVGRADELLESLLIISPVAIADIVPNARPRQANLYFTSSDADVYDRYEAAQRMGELKEGKVGALAGWRLYSSGPGIYIGLVISRLFGIRRSHGRVVIDPVLPKSMNGAELCFDWNGKKVLWIYHVTKRSFDPSHMLVNNAPVEDCQRMQQSYRGGGLSIDAARFGALLDQEENVVEIYL
jgi:cellobiose phosphorylase